MKLYELAKQLGFKSADVLTKAKELNLGINAITQNIKDHDIEILTKAFENTPRPQEEPEKVELDKIPFDLKKGAFIGIVYDGNSFNLVTTKLSLDQVKKYETEVISNHTSVHGAIIELVKKIPKYINIETVKKF